MSLVSIPHRQQDSGKRRCGTASISDDTVFVCRLMEAAIAAAFAVPVEELRARSRRTAAAAFARQCAMYLAHVTLRLSLSETGALFQRDRTTAAYACQVVERRRDNVVIDHRLDMLEALCDNIARCVRSRPQVRP